MKKIGLWGSISSIVALIISLYSFNASSQGVYIENSGNKNPVINNPSAPVHIEYDSHEESSSRGLYLRDPQGGRPPLLLEPRLAYFMDASKQVCHPLRGAKIKLLGISAKEHGMDFWEKIEVIEEGACLGKQGWVVGANISRE